MNREDPIRNSNAVPLEQMKPYFGSSVAWSSDGKQILAHHRDLGELFAELDRRGIKDFIIEYMEESSVFDDPPANGFPAKSTEASR